MVIIEPKLAYYIEEYNNAGEEMKQAMRKMDKYRCYAKKEYEIDIANDRSYN